MALLLNKRTITFFFLLSVCLSMAQMTTRAGRSDDYKDPNTHEKFRKRRVTVSNWQINQLKQGALVVRLNTNKLAIEGLKKQGLNDEAEKARLEQAAVNVNMMRAFAHNYTFSKVYFIYSNFTDSLTKGARSGIFVDTTLRINPSITMNEKFYLLAETDYVYNSSLGFLPEDSAKVAVERGNPSSSEFPIVVKNKYGHQLKNPFPFATSKNVFAKSYPVTQVNIEGNTVPFTVQSIRERWSGGSNRTSTYNINGKPYELTIPRLYTYEAMSAVVQEFDAELTQFYRSSAQVPETSKDFQDAKPFMY